MYTCTHTHAHAHAHAHARTHAHAHTHTHTHTLETEKYAHVTFFFNGGIEKPFDHEDRLMVPSPKVPTYDLQPEMNAEGVGKAVSKALHYGA